MPRDLSVLPPHGIMPSFLLEGGIRESISVDLTWIPHTMQASYQLFCLLISGFIVFDHSFSRTTIEIKNEIIISAGICCVVLNL